MERLPWALSDIPNKINIGNWLVVFRVFRGRSCQEFAGGVHQDVLV